MASVTPDLLLLSQLQGITTPNYTVWWQIHVCVNNLPKVVAWKRKAGSRTRNLWRHKSNTLTITPVSAMKLYSGLHSIPSPIYAQLQCMHKSGKDPFAHGGPSLSRFTAWGYVPKQTLLTPETSQNSSLTQGMHLNSYCKWTMMMTITVALAAVLLDSAADDKLFLLTTYERLLVRHSLFAECVVIITKHSSVHLSIILSTASGLAAEVWHKQQTSIDSCCFCVTCGPRKFWYDCKEVQHICSILFWLKWYWLLIL